jgi:hypothetical protein
LTLWLVDAEAETTAEVLVLALSDADWDASSDAS